MAAVTRPARALLAELIEQHGHADTPRVYTDLLPIRELFWRRLDPLMKLCRSRGGRVLDFGGGNGVLLPTLARRFDEVVCVDLDAAVARALAEREGLARVVIREGPIDTLGLPDDHFDAVTACDVLEHMKDLPPLVHALVRVLKPGGELLVSLPTENRMYELGRAVIGYEKPSDHFHTGAEVVEELARHLELDAVRYFPIPLAPIGLFLLVRLVKPARA